MVSSYYPTARHLVNYCFDDDGAGGSGGVAGPPVDLTTMSRAEKPSKNSNATNHHVGSSGTRCIAIRLFFANRGLQICGLL